MLQETQSKKVGMRIKPLHIAISVILFQSWHSRASVLYVNLASNNPLPPYAAWSTAATNIQDAVDSANTGDQILVTNGLYGIGSRMTSDGVTNRIAVTNAV